MNENRWENDRNVTEVALAPASAGGIKTLPRSTEMVSSKELDSRSFSEVTGANASYLQVVWGDVSDRTMGAGMVVLLTPFFSLLPFVAFYMFGDDDLGVLSAALLMMLLLCFLYYVSVASFVIVPRGEVVRFCRKSGKIYKAYAPRKQVIGFVVPTKRRAEIVAYDWANVRAEITKGYYATGATAGRLHFLQLAVLDPQTKQVIDRFIIGKKSFVGFADRVQLWELIRRYMQEPDRKWDYVPTNVYRESSFESFDYANPVSIFLRNETTPAFFIGLFGWLLSPVMALAGVSRWIIFHLTTAPDWRELDRSVFQYPEQRDEQKPNLSAAERRRRVRWMWVWVLSVGLAMAGFVAIAVMHSSV
ncbi:DUF6708 domain-containing protein [Nitrogeniibacter aestuarii]|uniref:DUF6708 domain-containing protein n=1 Tax=Nitrogeniibacter aestuarii TaxID=2815343 RepID=UPI001E2B61BF|nr:DUF6708 domain-containing protein [Nitrogeniibacter aestuarii]